MEFVEGKVKIRIATEWDKHPDRSISCDEIEPAFLYSMLQPASFAHMLRETLVITYANLYDLGLADRSYRSLPNTLFQAMYQLLNPGKKNIS